MHNMLARLDFCGRTHLRRTIFGVRRIADDEHHHEELTQDQLGTVQFSSVSCTPEAQATFLKGVALLHSFWYEEAEKTFRDVRAAGPEVRMAASGHGDEFVAPALEIIQRGDHQAASAELKAADKAKAPTEARARSHPGAGSVLFQ